MCQWKCIPFQVSQYLTGKQHWTDKCFTTCKMSKNFVTSNQPGSIRAASAMDEMLLNITRTYTRACELRASVCKSEMTLWNWYPITMEESGKVYTCQPLRWKHPTFRNNLDNLATLTIQYLRLLPHDLYLWEDLLSYNVSTVCSQHRPLYHWLTNGLTMFFFIPFALSSHLIPCDSLRVDNSIRFFFRTAQILLSMLKEMCHLPYRFSVFLSCHTLRTNQTQRARSFFQKRFWFLCDTL